MKVNEMYLLFKEKNEQNKCVFRCQINSVNRNALCVEKNSN